MSLYSYCTYIHIHMHAFVPLYVRSCILSWLQTAWPRAPTEKLLSEMFSGKSAYFQAILTALEDPSHQRAEQLPPQPTNTDLDVDTYLEVHLELVTAGADIAMKCLVTGGGEGKDSGSSISPQLSLEGSLMDMSVQGLHVCA